MGMFNKKYLPRGAVAAVVALLGASVAAPAAADVEAEAGRGDRATTIAIIGDAPYGTEQEAGADDLVDAINADPDVRTVIHLGDTKSGSRECSNEYFRFIRRMFNRFDDPLYYTPGDNEWTDCHRDNNGAYNPLNRLNRLRLIYYINIGVPFGGRGNTVSTQHERGYPENQMWFQNGVQISLIHVVGSNNGAAPWWNGTDVNPRNGRNLTARREAEVADRNAAAIAWMHRAFDSAERRDAAGVMLVWHGDLWAAFENANPDTRLDATDDFVQQVADRAAAFGKPVLIVNGDTHDYYAWHPFSDEDTHPLAEYYTFRGIDLATVDSDFYHGEVTRAPNVTQVVFDIWDRFVPEPEGFGPEDFGWLRVTIDPDSPEVFSFTQEFIDRPAAD